MARCPEYNACRPQYDDSPCPQCSHPNQSNSTPLEKNKQVIKEALTSAHGAYICSASSAIGPKVLASSQDVDFMQEGFRNIHSKVQEALTALDNMIDKDELIEKLNGIKRKERDCNLPENTKYQNGFDVGFNFALEDIIKELS